MNTTAKSQSKRYNNNYVRIVGNIGKDAILTYAENGTAVLRFNLATNDHFREKTYTEWHQVVMFGPRAEELHPFCISGAFLRIEGRLRTSSYDKDGEKRYSTGVVAWNVIRLGKTQQPDTEEESQPHVDDTLEDDIPF